MARRHPVGTGRPCRRCSSRRCLPPPIPCLTAWGLLGRGAGALHLWLFTLTALVMLLLMRWLSRTALRTPDPGRLVLSGRWAAPSAVGVRYRHLGHDPGPHRTGGGAAREQRVVCGAALLGLAGERLGRSGWWPPW